MLPFYGGGGYGLGMYGVNPYQQLWQQLQQQPQLQMGISPQQMLALQNSRGGYGANSPYQAIQQQMAMNQQALAPQAAPQPMPQNPSIGLSDLVRQWSQGGSPIQARQGLAGLAGLPMQGPGYGSMQPQFQAPQIGSYSSQQRMPAASGYNPAVSNSLRPSQFRSSGLGWTGAGMSGGGPIVTNRRRPDGATAAIGGNPNYTPIPFRPTNL